MAFLRCAIFVVIVTISGLEPQIFDASLPGSLVSFSKVADILEAAVHNLQIPKGETHRKPKFCCWPCVTTLQFRLTNFTEFYCTTTVVGVLLIFFYWVFVFLECSFTRELEQQFTRWNKASHTLALKVRNVQALLKANDNDTILNIKGITKQKGQK